MSRSLTRSLRKKLAPVSPERRPSSREYGATCTWQGDRQLLVSRKGLDAKVNIEERRIHIELNLGFMLTPLSGVIKNGITKELSGILNG